MFQFCFNDCIPKDGTNDGLVSHLSETLTHYDTIKRKFTTSIDGIITDRYPSDLILNNSQFSLANCIGQLSRELKKIALSNFNKYPIDNYYALNDIDSLLERGYSIEINANPLDALNAKIVEENGGILFTLPIHDDLKKNRLTITDKEKLTVEVLNQYGGDINSEYISDYIKADIIKRLDGFTKLLAMVGDCKHNDRFQRDFATLNHATQTFLLKEIEHAINRNAFTRFYPDDKLIKDVTPDDERKIKVFELRIFSPVAIRMYFYETPTKIYFGSIEGKPKKKVQDSDILNAVSIIKEIISLEG